MTLQISSRTVSTRVHNAVATAEDLKGVAIAAVIHQLGLGDDVVLSSEASVGEDGSIAVEVVEAVPAAPDETAPAPQPQGAGEQPAIPLGIGAPRV